RSRGRKSMRTQDNPVNAKTALAGLSPRLQRPALQAAVVGLVLSAGMGLLVPMTHAQDGAEAGSAPVPAERTAAAARCSDWRVPHVSWGDPDLQGTFTSRDMSGIPMERPVQYGMRQHLTSEEFRQRVEGGSGGLAALAASQGNDGSRLE